MRRQARGGAFAGLGKPAAAGPKLAARPQTARAKCYLVAETKQSLSAGRGACLSCSLADVHPEVLVILIQAETCYLEEEIIGQPQNNLCR